MTGAADRQQGQRATSNDEPNQHELDDDTDQLVDPCHDELVRVLAALVLNADRADEG
jgi:hypothetical protein